MNGKRFLAFVLLLGLLVAGPAIPRASAAPSAAVEPDLEVPSALLRSNAPVSWWAAVQEDIHQSEYYVTWQDITYLIDLPAAYQAPNRAHNLRTYFTPQGIRVIPRTETDPSWELGLALTGGAGVGELAVEGNRIVYERAGLSELYVNDEDGLEHAVTVAVPPSASNLQLLISTNLTPHLTPDGGAVEFTKTTGETVLCYGNIAATDAAGRSVPLQLYLLDTTLHVQLPRSNFCYPLTVRASLTSPDFAPEGLSPTPSWGAEGDQDGAHLGEGVSTVGDVNGDGYSDVLVGATTYDNGQTDEGVAFLYYGSATGPSTTPDWMAESDQSGANLGRYAVGIAGDVNGDGYADIIVGAPHYENGPNVEGRAYIYYGNAGDGLELLPRQLRTDGSVPIAPLGKSDADDAFQIRLNARMPLGRDQVKLHWQAAPLGTPFTSTDVISGTSDWVDTLTGGVVIVRNVTGLTQGTPYHWRVRLLYRPGNRLGQPAGRWMHIPWNGWTETDLRTADGPITGLTATNDSPTRLGDTTTLTATADGWYITYEWDFGDGESGVGGLVTHTYAAEGIYNAVVTASNGVASVTATTVVTVEEVISGL